MQASPLFSEQFILRSTSSENEQTPVILEIVEAVDGPLRGEAPAVGNASAASLDRPLAAVCAEAARLTRDVLAGVTLADLVDGFSLKAHGRPAKHALR